MGAKLQCATGANFSSFVEINFFEHATQATPVIQGRRQVALPQHSMHNSRTLSAASALPCATTCRIVGHHASALCMNENVCTMRDIVRKLRSSSATQTADVMANQNSERRPAGQTQ